MSSISVSKFVVKTSETKNEETSEVTYTIGVTDLVFNPLISVYEKSLLRPDGKEKVSPAYWNQQPEVEDLPYFEYRDKNPDAVNDDDFIDNPWAYRTIG